EPDATAPRGGPGRGGAGPRDGRGARRRRRRGRAAHQRRPGLVGRVARRPRVPQAWGRGAGRRAHRVGPRSARRARPPTTVGAIDEGVSDRTATAPAVDRSAWRWRTYPRAIVLAILLAFPIVLLTTTEPEVSI